MSENEITPEVVEEEESALDIMLNIKRDIEEYRKTSDRTELISAMRDYFLIQRFKTSIDSEECRQHSIKKLRKRLDTVNSSGQEVNETFLLRVVTELSRSTDNDVRAVTGGGEGRPLVQQFIGQTNTNDSSRSSGSGAGGELLEALEHLSNHFKEKGITIESMAADIEAEKEAERLKKNES